MTTFTELMDQYAIAGNVNTAIESMLDNAEYAQCLLHYLVVNGVVTGNLRDVARFTAKFLCQYRDMGIHDKTKTVLRECELRQNKQYGIGYLHMDGSYHWFAVEDDRAAEQDIAYEALKQTMLDFDWYYHFTDDGRVWKAGEAAYKAMIQECKALGLSEEDARQVQALCLKERGITSMEGVAYINY